MSSAIFKGLHSISIKDLALFMNKDVKDLARELGDFTSQKIWSQTSVPPEVVREFLKSKFYVYPQKTISLQMLKGGVAKTTSALNIGLRAAMYGARVLFVDLDQQANLSSSLGVEIEDEPVWLDLIEKKLPIESLVKAIDSHIDLIPSSLNNSVLDRALMNSHRNWSESVRAPLETLKKQYDLILIDTAPALSAVNTAVTVASDEVVLPVTPEKFAVMGLKKHLEELQEVRRDFNLAFKSRILFTRFDGREKGSSTYLQDCLTNYADLLMRSYVRNGTEAKSRHAGRLHLFNAQSAVKEDYDLVARELLSFPL